MYTNHEAKENHSRRGSYLLNIAYYKLWAREYFAYYIISQSIESYRIGYIHKILNQALMFPRVRCIRKAIGMELEILARTDLGNSQRHSCTVTNVVEGDLPNAIRNVMQANHWSGAPSIDGSYRMICS